MSTSISFAISSADQELGPTSKSFVDLRRSHPDCYLSPNRPARGADRGHGPKQEPYERRHTGLGSTGAEPDFFESGTSKLRRWRHHTHRDSLSDSRSELSREGEPGEDFYEEVDERMSRNSLEYPEHQAKYIDRWLKDLARSPATMRTRSFDDDHHGDEHRRLHNESCDHIKGNVIGIRGFSSDNSIGSIRYNNLRGEYLRLQSSHNKLRRQFEEASRQYEQIFKKKKKKEDQDVVSSRCRCRCPCRRDQPDRDQGQQSAGETLRPSRGSLELEVDRLREELRRLELTRGQEGAAAAAAEGPDDRQLRQELEASKRELAELEARLRNLSLEPKNRRLLALYNENVRLREGAQAGLVEFRALEDNYARLEQRLQSICREQECQDKERGAETNRLFLELCRLQVYQPKLEGLLDTERQIKQELQSRLDNLSKENTGLRDTVEDKERELGLARARSRGLESIEMETVRGELAHLADRCERLAREKEAADELLRAAQSRVALLETRHRNEMDSLRDRMRADMEGLRRDVSGLAAERDSLLAKVAGWQERSRAAERAAEEQVADMQKRLELMRMSANDSGGSSRELADRLELAEGRLRAADDRLTSLTGQLETSETERRELHDELADKRNQLEQCRQQVQELRHRLDLQTASFGQLREQKDKELARLRVELNFEQYNRRVALKGLERELRASLKEVETMKCRFTRRSNVESDSHNSSRTSNCINKCPSALAASLGNKVHQPNSSSNCSNDQTVKLQQPQDAHCNIRQQQQQQQQLNSVATKLVKGPGGV